MAALVPLASWGVLRSRSRGWTDRSLVLMLIGISAIDFIVWGSSPFTGWSGHPGTETLVTGGVRYLLPGFAPAAIAVAVASRNRALWPFCAVVLLMATGLDAWRFEAVGYPYRPSLAALAIGIAVGMAFVWTVHSFKPSVLSVASPYLPFGLLVVAVVGFARPTDRYFQRHLAVSSRTGVDFTAVLSWLSGQPGWSGGHAPVAMGPDADVSFMGASFAHPLTVLDANVPCARVRASAEAGWLVLSGSATDGGVFGVTYPVRKCMNGYSPVFSHDGTSVYTLRSFPAPP